MLVDYTNQRRAAENNQNGFDSSQPCSFAPHFLMTNAMVFVPYCISGWSRCEWKNGLAWVIIGGLISSLFLTLIIVPVIYEIMEN
jgi:HAE1 family hydrophobic/amphiphilic exporter-1